MYNNDTMTIRHIWDHYSAKRPVGESTCTSTLKEAFYNVTFHTFQGYRDCRGEHGIFNLIANLFLFHTHVARSKRACSQATGNV